MCSFSDDNMTVIGFYKLCEEKIDFLDKNTEITLKTFHLSE